MSDTTVVTVVTAPNEIGRMGAPVIPQRRRETMAELSEFFGACAGGAVKAGSTVTVQQNPGETAAQASGTITLNTFVAGQGVAINGAPFSGTANADPGKQQFTIGGTDTITAANLAAAINASTDPRVAGVVTATSAATVLTVTTVSDGKSQNSVTIAALGGMALGSATVSGGSGVETITLNGVAVTATWATSDANTALLLAAAINASANALVKNFFFATVGTAAHNTVVYIYALFAGAVGNTFTLAASGTGMSASGALLTGGSAGSDYGVQASGTWTTAAGSGTQTLTINGVVFSNAWATSDTASAAAMLALVNASVNPLVAGIVICTVAAGVITIKSIDTGVQGNAITLAASGTGASVSGARLTGGTPRTEAALSGGTAVTGQTGAVQLANGVGGEGVATTFQF